MFFSCIWFSLFNPAVLLLYPVLRTKTHQRKNGKGRARTHVCSYGKLSAQMKPTGKVFCCKNVFNESADGPFKSSLVRCLRRAGSGVRAGARGLSALSRLFAPLLRKFPGFQSPEAVNAAPSSAGSGSPLRPARLLSRKWRSGGRASASPPPLCPSIHVPSPLLSPSLPPGLSPALSFLSPFFQDQICCFFFSAALFASVHPHVFLLHSEIRRSKFKSSLLQRKT